MGRESRFTFDTDNLQPSVGCQVINEQGLGLNLIVTHNHSASKMQYSLHRTSLE
jgi:hypothetical protein